jgi:DNA-binding LacI/PurR family transcriptional regulator
MVCVLATLRQYTDLATAPGWSDEFLALDVVRRLSLAGRPAALVDLKFPPAGGLDSIFAARPGAMVVTGGVNNDPIAMRALARCREAGIPVATYGNAPELRPYDRAYSDHRAGSRELTRWLFAQGCRRIVPFFPSDPVLFWESERIEGYNEAMREAGLEPMPCAVFGDAELRAQTSGERHFRVFRALAISKLLELRREGGIDALLCLNDSWVPHVAAAMRELGLEPNRDIILAGYDNGSIEALPSPFAYERPAVTIDKHNERSAEDLAALVVARMDGTLPPEPQARIHANELVVIHQEQANTRPGVKP